MISKRFLLGKCRITFEWIPEINEQIKTVSLVGDFNDWNEQTHLLERNLKRFSLTLDLEPNRIYQFRYLVNGVEWHNDEAADSYCYNPFSGHSSILNTYPNSAMVRRYRSATIEGRTAIQVH